MVLMICVTLNSSELFPWQIIFRFSLYAIFTVLGKLFFLFFVFTLFIFFVRLVSGLSGTGLGLSSAVVDPGESLLESLSSSTKSNGSRSFSILFVPEAVL